MLKRVFCLLLLCPLAYVSVNGQVPNISKPAVTTTGPGKLLTQFTNALQPASLINSFASQKSSFLTKAGKVTDAIGMAQTISSLVGFIKPDMFKTEFNAATLLQTAHTVKTFAEGANMLKKLEGGLKPEAFVSGWASQRSGWISALNLLK